MQLFCSGIISSLSHVTALLKTFFLVILQNKPNKILPTKIIVSVFVNVVGQMSIFRAKIYAILHRGDISSCYNREILFYGFYKVCVYEVIYKVHIEKIVTKI